jgi:mannose-6-phosphate isomerase
MKDVHTEHCCIFHGCKYGDNDCTVTTKLAAQSHPCEDCGYDGIDIRPWGTYQVLVDAPTHKVKTITVKAGKRLSLQRHKHRSETWICVQGQGLVTKGQDMNDLVDDVLEVGDDVHIPATWIHRIAAGPDGVTFIEVQTGTYFGEDDIERFQDDFGRTS